MRTIRLTYRPETPDRDDQFELFFSIPNKLRAAPEKFGAWLEEKNMKDYYMTWTEIKPIKEVKHATRTEPVRGATSKEPARSGH